MNPTRHPPPLRIYHDPPPPSHHVSSHPHLQHPYGPSRQLQPSPMPLQPIHNVTANRNIVLDPPMKDQNLQSPVKSHQKINATEPGKGKLEYIPVSAPPAAYFAPQSPAKRAQYYHYPTIGFQPMRQPLFTTFSSVPDPQPQLSAGAAVHESFAEMSASAQEVQASIERAVMQSTTGKDRVSKKQRRDDKASFELPEPHQMPHVEDDGSKPPFSYAILIGMAILRAPGRRLTLAQIYKWISDNFSYYQSIDSGWQNSIRHNLSLNKAFVKQERPKNDPGKGNYWTIVPGMESQFLKEKPVNRPPIMAINRNPRLPEPQRVEFQPSVSVQPPEHVFSINDDLSSDATIAASDAPQDDNPEDDISVPNSPSPAVRSSPLQLPRSSPPLPSPLAPPVFLREATPPTPSRPSTATATTAAAVMAATARPRKRKVSLINDSGYFSSLESSAKRQQKPELVATSDLDIEPPLIKAGRAEAEIARIRSSSQDISPVRCASLKDTIQFLNSSPLRNEVISVGPPPLTPAIKFKKPLRPPPSLSPNTNLRNHRKKIQRMVNSPIKHLGLAEDMLPWSPAFNIQDPALAQETLNGASLFDIFDHFGPSISPAAVGSPEKRVVKHDRISANVLADITAVSGNTRLGTPVSRVAKARILKYNESPCKRAAENMGYNEDLFSFNLFSDDAPVDADGIDLLQGFQKIGNPNRDDKTPPVIGNRRRGIARKG